MKRIHSVTVYDRRDLLLRLKHFYKFIFFFLHLLFIYFLRLKLIFILFFLVGLAIARCHSTCYLPLIPCIGQGSCLLHVTLIYNLSCSIAIPYSSFDIYFFWRWIRGQEWLLSSLSTKLRLADFISFFSIWENSLNSWQFIFASCCQLWWWFANWTDS